MRGNISFMNGEELLLELIILYNVRENLEHLIIYNSDIKSSINQVDKDIKQIKGLMFFKYHHFEKVDLSSLMASTELKNRMLKYLDTKGIS